MRGAVFARLLGSLACVVFAATTAAQPRLLEEGREYARIEPVLATQATADRIEILDVFWYGCPVCSELEPMMTYWGGEIRGDLVLRRMPAIWNKTMQLHARIFYTAVALELEQTVHHEVFRRIHEQQQALNHVDLIRALFGELGVTEQRFEQAWNSPEVEAALARAEQDTRDAGIERLPALLVNGRYRVERNDRLQDLPELVLAVNELIKRERDLRRPVQQ
jgi:thiol:disulfide interchange protein DsbA